MMLVDLWFLSSAHCLFLFYIYTKFRENISNDFRGIELGTLDQ